MVRTIGRKQLWVYALLMVVAAIGYAKYDVYQMDGDGVSFMDIAQFLRTGHAGLAINGYWNPGYPAILAAAEALTHPSLWNELVVIRYANVAVFLMAMAACVFFTSGLIRARAAERTEPGTWAVSSGALHLLGLGLLVLSMGRELPIAAPRSDTLLLVFFLLAMGLFVRLFVGAGLWMYPLLGLTLGCAYLTKSFAFLPSVALILGLLLWGALSKRPRRARLLTGGVLTALTFALSAGPYIVAVSNQLHHFTTGDSARMNYAFFIDDTQRWHEWYHHTLGQATGPFTHPELLIAAPPPVFSYAAHPYGTFPLWFDPAWWTAGLKPHLYLRGHILRFARNCVVFVRYLLNRPEPLVLLAVVLIFGAALRSAWRSRAPAHLWAWVPIAWGLLMLGIYFPIDLQDRYLTGPFLLVVLSVFALLQAKGSAAESSNTVPTIATALVMLLAWISLAQAGTYLAERRRQTPPADQRHPGFNREVFAAAGALDRLGLTPGGRIACMGDRACYVDPYWVRLAGAQVYAEVETPNEADPQTEWDAIPDKAAITQPLAKLGVQYIVTIFANSACKPPGWIQLGHSNFFAYPLQHAVPPAEAAAVSDYQPTP